MKQFEVGKIYEDDAMAYEITKRTAKTVTFVEIQHLGRFNEKRSEPKTKKISDWGIYEVAYPSNNHAIVAY